MKRQTLLTAIFILLSHLLLAQAKTDTIGTTRNWLGVKVLTYECEKITMHKLTKLVRQDPEAFHFLKKGKTH